VKGAIVSVHSYPLISIRSDATVQEAARLMSDCSIGAVGVLGEKREFIGIITERDLSWFVAQGKDGHETRVRDIANDFPVVVDGPIDETSALERMKSARIRHLIVHENGDFRIVSIRDFLFTPSSPRTRELKARDVMTAPAIACRDQAFFEEVAEVLADREISGMPVVDATNKVVGVISERDLAHVLGGEMVRLAVHRQAHGPFMREPISEIPRSARRAKEVMSSPPLTIGLDTALEEIARLMSLNRVNRLPVVDAGRLVGVVTRGDVLGAVGHLDHAEMDLTRPPILVGSSDELPGVMASTLSHL
jgi:CBS domain-containing protein